MNPSTYSIYQYSPILLSPYSMNSRLTFSKQFEVIIKSLLVSRVQSVIVVQMFLVGGRSAQLVGGP